MFGAELLCSPAIVSAPSGLLLDNLTVAPMAAFSFRKVRTAYAGPCCRIRNGTTNAEQDFGFAGGVVDVASIAAALGGAAGYISKWYSQTAGSTFDFPQSITTSQPIFVPTGLDGLPAVQTGPGYFETATGVVGIGSATMQTCIVHQAGGASGDYAFGLIMVGPTEAGTQGYGAHQMSMDRYSGGYRAIAAGANTVQAPLNIGSAQQCSMTTDGTNLTLRANRSQIGQAAASNVIDSTGQWVLGADTTGSNTWSGLWSEIIVAAGSNAGDLATIEASEHTFWGTP